MKHFDMSKTELSLASAYPLPERLTRRDWLLAAAVFILALVIYTLTLAPTVNGEDGGELIAASYLTGVAHPPGYPLWCLLTRPFFLLPHGDPAWRANFASSFWGALTAAGALLLARRWGADRIGAWVAGAALTGARMFWLQSTIAEVYTLNAFLLIVILHLIESCLPRMAGRPEPTAKQGLALLGLGLVIGLSLANHYQLMLMVGPALLVLFLPVFRYSWRRCWGYGAGAVLLAAIGLLTYAYLYFAARGQPYMNWGNPATWGAFWAHLRRDAYRELQFGNADAITGGIKLLFIGHALDEFWTQFTPWLLPLLPFGIYQLWRSSRLRTVGAFGIMALNVLVCVFALAFTFEKENRQRMEPYYLPAYVTAAILLGLGASHLLLTARRWREARKSAQNQNVSRIAAWLPYAAAMLTALVAVLPMAANYRECDRSGFTIARRYSEIILQEARPNAIIYPGADFTTFPLVYLIGVEGLRPDVTLLNKEGDLPDAETVALLHRIEPATRTIPSAQLHKQLVIEACALKSGRPVYVTSRIDFQPRPGVLELVPCGLLYRVVPAGSPFPASREPETALTDKELALAAASADAMERALAASGYLMSAEDCYCRRRDQVTGDGYLGAAARALADDHRGLNNLGSVAAHYGRQRLAVNFYQQALALWPEYVTPLMNLARMALTNGDLAAVGRLLAHAEELAPASPPVRRLRQDYAAACKEAERQRQLRAKTTPETTTPADGIEEQLKQLRETERYLRELNHNPQPTISRPPLPILPDVQVPPVPGPGPVTPPVPSGPGTRPTPPEPATPQR